MNYINFYLTGVAVATIITVIMLAVRKKVCIGDILESLTGILSSWVLLFAIFVKLVKTLLNATGKNKVLWEQKQKEKKLIKMKK